MPEVKNNLLAQYDPNKLSYILTPIRPKGDPITLGEFAAGDIARPERMSGSEWMLDQGALGHFSFNKNNKDGRQIIFNFKAESRTIKELSEIQKAATIFSLRATGDFVTLKTAWSLQACMIINEIDPLENDAEGAPRIIPVIMQGAGYTYGFKT